MVQTHYKRLIFPVGAVRALLRALRYLRRIADHRTSARHTQWYALSVPSASNRAQTLMPVPLSLRKSIAVSAKVWRRPLRVEPKAGHRSLHRSCGGAGGIRVSHGIIAAALTTLAGRRARRPAFQHCCRATRTSRRQCAHSCIVSRNGPAVASHACRSSQRIMAELPEQRRAPEQAVDDAGALVLPPPRVHAVRLAMVAKAVPEPGVTSYRPIWQRSDRFGRVLS